jgi:predicted small metal-binding protein
MPSKRFECPKCGFAVEAESEEEVIKHVKMHGKEHHPDFKMSEKELKQRIK